MGLSRCACKNLYAPATASHHPFELFDYLESGTGIVVGGKAGIIKPADPVVSAPQKDEALEVLFREASDRNALFTLGDRDNMCKQIQHSLDGQSCKVLDPRHQTPEVERNLPLFGLHQVENADIAYTAIGQSGLYNSLEHGSK